MSKSKTPSFRFIDLFAGIGGLRIPFDRNFSDSLNGECVFTCEFDKFAVQTYSANFEQINPVDVTSVNNGDLSCFNINCFVVSIDSGSFGTFLSESQN